MPIYGKIGGQYKPLDHVYANVDGSMVSVPVIQNQNGTVFQVQTVGDVELPVTLRTNETPIQNYQLKGKDGQSGTPTPDNPIQPEFVGVRTSNLVDIATFQDNMHLDMTTGLPTPFNGDRIATMQPIDVSQYSNVKLTFSEATQNAYFMYSLFNGDTLIERVANKRSGSTIDTSSATKMYLSLYPYTVSDVTYIMLNFGSTALPYEPYGYKITITINGDEIKTVYLSEPLAKIGNYADVVDYKTQTVTRRVRKLVLTGTEIFTKAASNPVFTLTLSGINSESGITTVSTHYKSQNNVSGTGNVGNLSVAVRRGYSTLYIGDDSFTTAADFKAYLAAQYEAGTPVTIWYVLRDPEIEQITVPKLETTKRECTLSIDTEVAPTFLSVTVRRDSSSGTKSFTYRGVKDVSFVPPNHGISQILLDGAMQMVNNLPKMVGDFVTSGTYAGQYAVPITCDGVTSTVYISKPLARIYHPRDSYGEWDFKDFLTGNVGGSSSISRRVKQLALTGQENWRMQQSYGTGGIVYTFYLQTAFSVSNRYHEVYCTHFRSGDGYASGTFKADFKSTSRSDLYINGADFNASSYGSMALSYFKQTLAQLYAAGTPITIIYPNSTIETETITFPTITTSQKDTTTYDSTLTLKPSVSFTGQIRQMVTENE